MMLPGQRWYPSHRADPRALALYLRHYSSRVYVDGRPRKQFVAPGACIVLLTASCDALWVWHRAHPGLRLDKQEGVSCAVFRNEGPYRASELIREAEQIAWVRWPGERLFTYVDPTKTRAEVAGYCFLRARWRRCGVSKKGLLLFEKRPKGAAG
jgi:hypothetical protein